MIRHPALVRLLETFNKGRAQRGAAQDGGGAGGRGADLGREPRSPRSCANIYILPGVPEIFRQKFEALKERFRDSPFHLCCVFVSIGEGTLADHLNALLGGHPDLLLGSYPEFSNAEYKVKVTLESKDQGYLDDAVEDFLGGCRRAVVRVER